MDADKSKGVRIINHRLAEDRRLELNKINADNQRLKLGISKKNWKKLKRFHIVYNRTLEENITKYTTELIENNLQFTDDASEVIFDHYERRYRSSMGFIVHKLGLHTKEGKEEIFDKFADFVRKSLTKAAEQKKAEQKEIEGLNSEIVVELISIALRNAAPKDSIVIPTVTTYTDLIKGLKEFVPRGHKGEFEKQALKHLKKLKLS